MHLKGFHLTKNSDGLSFSYVDEGKSGAFAMGIEYTPFPDTPQIYNLGFGLKTEKEENGQMVPDLDDEFDTKNGNIGLVMATMAHTMFAFWEVHPDKMIWIKGSTPERKGNDNIRSLLYHRMLNNHGHQLDGKAKIYGVKNGIAEPLKKNTDENYYAFILKPIIHKKT